MALNDHIRQQWAQSKILLLGGSAGSFKLLFRLVKILPKNLGKSVIIVIHRKKNFFSEIEKLFSENSRMLLTAISDKEPIRENTIYIAPANYHTLVENEGFFSLDVSEPVWYSKPSIDVTFESVAEVYKQHVTAVLFSGANQDGAEGLLKLRREGALTIAQDPQDAEMVEMPQSAIDINAAEYVLRTTEIFELLESNA
ncbi:chemotaxis protein CheB [Mucilaginibacter phyllosphaerae]|uniref:protein-glutamate methylesterase n=1 Tax=Mucilaginibacter phyllosphaerae TaxID=1812349 RepID=A0ABR6I646_9SPHI|nr:chemotaxis protein CheB [Mucilaginibacter phyllosphaerae]MBB3968345.1 two-component system chemotaxis response regulator CheB [Mucilaginibacter phyllosphaerae]GGG99581.1 putative chemotaxis protein-glutamate methylesterase [Mucilaginibacter phyllosphaerae]